MSKAKGSRAERKAIKLLEAEGYVCMKAGGSLGVFDVIALGPNAVRCLQVTAGSARLSRDERAAIAAGNAIVQGSMVTWNRLRQPVPVNGLSDLFYELIQEIRRFDHFTNRMISDFGQFS